MVRSDAVADKDFVFELIVRANSGLWEFGESSTLQGELEGLDQPVCLICNEARMPNRSFMSPTQFCLGWLMLVTGLVALSVAPSFSGSRFLAGWTVASFLLAISGAAAIATVEKLSQILWIGLLVIGTSLFFASFHSFLDRGMAGVILSAEMLALGTGLGFRVLHRETAIQQPSVARVEFGLSAPAPSKHEIPDNDLEQRLLANLEERPQISFDEDEAEPHLQFESADRHVVQRIERGFRPDGSEWMEGMLLVEFRARQKTAIVHLPVWPAFATQPEIQSELLGGPDLEIEVKTIRRWGMRIELTRRASGLDPDSAELAFFISAKAAIREAA